MIVKRIQDVMSRSQFYDLLNTIHKLKQDTFDYYTTVPEYLLDQYNVKMISTPGRALLDDEFIFIDDDHLAYFLLHTV